MSNFRVCIVDCGCNERWSVALIRRQTGQVRSAPAASVPSAASVRRVAISPSTFVVRQILERRVSLLGSTQHPEPVAISNRVGTHEASPARANSSMATGRTFAGPLFAVCKMTGQHRVVISFGQRDHQHRACRWGVVFSRAETNALVTDLAGLIREKFASPMPKNSLSSDCKLLDQQSGHAVRIQGEDCATRRFELTLLRNFRLSHFLIEVSRLGLHCLPREELLCGKEYNLRQPPFATSGRFRGQ